MSAHRCASAFLDNEATEAVHNVGNEIDRFTAYDLGNGAPENTGKKKTSQQPSIFPARRAGS